MNTRSARSKICCNRDRSPTRRTISRQTVELPLACKLPRHRHVGRVGVFILCVNLWRYSHLMRSSILTLWGHGQSKSLFLQPRHSHVMRKPTRSWYGNAQFGHVKSIPGQLFSVAVSESEQHEAQYIWFATQPSVTTRAICALLW